MNETPTNQTPEQARRADYPSTGASTQPTGTIPPNFPPLLPSDRLPQTTYPQPASYKPQRQRHTGMGGTVLGPMFLIGAGVLFLLNNLGIVDWAIWGRLWRLWPLALVAVGLDMLFGRRKPWISFVIAIGMLVAGAALLLYGSIASFGEQRVYELNVPLSNAKSADIEIDFGSGYLHVDSSADPANLIAGNLQYYANGDTPHQDLNMDGDHADFSLSTSSDGFHIDLFAPPTSVRWNTNLNPTIPTSLKANLGTGSADFDLSNMKLTNLELDAGTGSATLIFPQPGGQVTASIDGGVGNLTLHIPAGTQASISVDSGVGNVDIDSRFVKRSDDTYTSDGYSAATNKLDLTVDAGAGNIKITR